MYQKVASLELSMVLFFFLACIELRIFVVRVLVYMKESEICNEKRRNWILAFILWRCGWCIFRNCFFGYTSLFVVFVWVYM